MKSGYIILRMQNLIHSTILKKITKVSNLVTNWKAMYDVYETIEKTKLQSLFEKQVLNHIKKCFLFFE